jgi:hypothetical protein
MKVLVAFEFIGIDPDSEVADQIVEKISKSCETLGVDFGSTNCYVDDCTPTE